MLSALVNLINTLCSIHPGHRNALQDISQPGPANEMAWLYYQLSRQQPLSKELARCG